MPMVSPAFTLSQFLKSKRQNSMPIPPKLTRFRKVTTKMLQHGASDLQATMAAEPREESKTQPEAPQKAYGVSTGKFHIVINIGQPA